LFKISGTVANSIGHTLEFLLSTEEIIARTIRWRDDTVIPTDPGLCIDGGFIPDSSGEYQEGTTLNIDFPANPDDLGIGIAYTKYNYPPSPQDWLFARYERARQAYAQAGIGWHVLRKDILTIGAMTGQEMLVRRDPAANSAGNTEAGGEDFNWEVFNQPGSTARPSSFVVRLSNASDTNLSLSDEETIQIWDRILASIRFRVPPPEK
jgi:hypothetical protein